MSTAMDEMWGPDEEQALLDTIDAWVEKSVAPIAREYDLEDKYPHQLVEEMKDLGLFGATISTEYGGLGLPARIYAKIVIKVSSVWMAPTGIFNSHLIMAAAIERCGTEEQKRKYLPRMATGELRGSLGLTEPNAGTDLQAIRTVARRESDHYVINGAKTWITNSMYGDMVLLLTKTDPEAQPRHKGMSMFIAEKGDGFIVAKKMKKSGYRAIDTCELAFQDYKVPADCLLGGVEGQGFQHAVGGLELGRINVAARGCGIAEGALRLSVRYDLATGAQSRYADVQDEYEDTIRKGRSQAAAALALAILGVSTIIAGVTVTAVGRVRAKRAGKTRASARHIDVRSGGLQVRF